MARRVTPAVWLLLASMHSGAAPPASPVDPAILGRLAIRTYSDADGLPQNSVMSMAFDRQQTLWIGTQDGAATFNGRGWTVVNMPNRSVSNYVRVVLPAADGSLWFGTDGGGLHRLKDGAWTTYDTKSGLPSNLVYALAESPAGTLWVGTRGGGLARLADGKWTVFDKKSGFPDDWVIGLLATPDGRIWAGTNGGGLAVLQNGRWTRYTTADGLPHNAVWSLLETVAPGGKRTLWAGTNGGGLGRFADGKWTSFDVRSGLSDNVVPSLLETASSGGGRILWIGTNNGLTTLEDGVFTRYDLRSGLPNMVISRMLKSPLDDGARTVWLGTNGGGVARLSRGKWLALDTRSGLPDNGVFALEETVGQEGDTTIWAGTRTGLGALTNGAWTRYDNRNGLPDSFVYCVLPDYTPNGRALWVGTRMGGLARLENGKWTVYSTKNGLPNDSVRALLLTGSLLEGRTLWVGTNGGGLASLRNGVWKVTDTRSGLPDSVVLSLLATPAESGEKELWVGTRAGGLARLAGGKWRTYSVADGLPNDRVYSLHESHWEGRQTVWAGTAGGVARLDLTRPDARWQTLSETTQPALPNDVIYAIREDRVGRIYLFTNKGVARLSPRQPTAADASEITVYTFTAEDGLPSNECNLGAALLDHKGRIWAGTVAGAAVFDPLEETEDALPKSLVVDRVLVAGRPRAVAGAALTHRENDLTFLYSLRSFFRDADTRFRTQLVGRDAEPADWTADGKAQYSNLPSGRYTFRVWARDYAGNPAGPVEVPFRIRAAAWQTWWAYAAYAALLAGVVIGAGRLRLRALRRRTAELEWKVEAKTAELRLSNRRLHEAQEQIGALMESGSQALQDIRGWSHAMAKDLARAIGATEISVWALQDGEMVALLSSATPASTPSADEVKELARRAPSYEARDERILPVKGMSGEVCGALVVSGRQVVWGPAEKRLLASFAYQLGGALELQKLRLELLGARERRAATRREMLERGIDVLRICPACQRCFAHGVERCTADGAPLTEPRLFPYRIAGRYRLSEVLGEGGMGVVFAARDERLDRDVAVKVIRAEHVNDPNIRLRFEQEARALARIDHPSVIGIYDSGELDDGSLFLVTELLRGLTLRQLLATYGRGTPRDVALLLRQGSAALGAAHRVGLIHRDIKPENIFLVDGPNGRQAKLLDFGVAKPFTEKSDLTRTGTVVGTPAYMSPEQIRGRELDRRSDVYSFAAVGYEALTGARWIRSDDMTEIYIEMKEGGRRLSSDMPGVPPVVEQAFARALAVNRDDRPTDVEKWVAVFVELLEEMPSDAGGWPPSLEEAVGVVEGSAGTTMRMPGGPG